MAIDAYLQIDGIKGESQDERHKGWIECLSVDFGVDKTIPKAKFEFMRADGDGTPVRYFEIDLENVLIGMVKPSMRPGAIMQENICLKFSKVKWKYSQQKIAGGIGGNTAGGWDLAANKVIA